MDRDNSKISLPAAGKLLPFRKTCKVVFLAAGHPAVVLERRPHFLVKNLYAQGHSRGMIEPWIGNFDGFPYKLGSARESGTFVSAMRRLPSMSGNRSGQFKGVFATCELEERAAG